MSGADGGTGTGRHLLLIGMMGAGKTTVGRLLAARLGRRYFDSDAQVVAATGMTVPEIFESQGEAVFRRHEREALRQAVAADDPVVVSVAGGAVLDPDNRTMLRAAGDVVWLRARPDTLARRVGAGEGRPLLADDPAGALTRLDAVRRPLYAELAHLALDVDDLGPDEAAELVVRELGLRPAAADDVAPEAGG